MEGGGNATYYDSIIICKEIGSECLPFNSVASETKIVQIQQSVNYID
jgi:hypothetical protein